MLLPHQPRFAQSAHQRVRGAARIAYAHARDGQTRLADLYQRAPCRFLFPDVEAGEPPQAVLLTTSGGLTGGDVLDVSVRAQAGSCATLATQAAEKLYRALPDEPDSLVQVALDVESGATLEWLAQETIVFDRARLRREIGVNLTGDARLLATESVVFGRAAMGERLQQGRVHEAWRVRRDGRLVWADALRIDGDVQAHRAAAFGIGDAAGCATVLYAGPDAQALLAPLRDRLADLERVAGATCFDGLLIVRLMAPDAALLRTSVRRVAGSLRAMALGLPEALPRVWTC